MAESPGEVLDLLETRRGCTLAWNPNQVSPVGDGGKRRHPRGVPESSSGCCSWVVFGVLSTWARTTLNQLVQHSPAERDQVIKCAQPDWCQKQQAPTLTHT